MAKRLPMLDWQVIVIAFTQKLFGSAKFRALAAPAVHVGIHTHLVMQRTRTVWNPVSEIELLHMH